jgi:Icc-related predicted phosphoesterase
MRIAAVGDVHCKKTSTGAFQGLFTAMAAAADVIVLCGDLTDLGLAEEARVLAKELSAAKTIRWSPCSATTTTSPVRPIR